MIEVHYSARIDEPEQDRRYRCLVVLGRSDRPTHYKWHCPRCTMPVGELINTEVTALTDMVDLANATTLGMGVRCDGRYQGGRCNVWYYFTLGSV